ncbi:MAG: hypothetical protein ACFFBI_15145 [Promethearchaeota archaeon]
MNENNNNLDFEDIWKEIVEICSRKTTIYTIKQEKPNKILECSDFGIKVETEKGTDIIPKEQIEQAWSFLVQDGELKRDEHKKSTYRSSFIIPLFIELEMVDLKSKTPLIIKLKKDYAGIRYFIFVFNDQLYEDSSFLGNKYFFPTPDKGGFKMIGKSTGSWGTIIDRVKINDKVIWTISGSSSRKDRKSFWGYGEIIGINYEEGFWEIKSEEFQNKVLLDEVINGFPNEYRDLYTQSQGTINIGFYGTIQIDKFQYNKIIEYCEDQPIGSQSSQDEEEGEGEVKDKASHNLIVLKLIDIGRLLEMDVWIASDLKNAIVNGERLGNLSIDSFVIPGVSNEVLNILKRIDVLWLKNNSVIAGFEVEHTTQIFSGLLRFFDLFLSLPSFDIRSYIIAPDHRENQVNKQFNRVTFKKLLKDVNRKIEVIYYSSLNDGYGIIKSIYEQGGHYDLDKFLINCVDKIW